MAICIASRNIRISAMIKKNKKTDSSSRGKVTIDQLALMVERGFNEVCERMDKGLKEVDERFDKVEDRLDKVEDRLDAVENKLDRIETRLDSLERRILAIEDILTEHGKDIKEIKNEIKAIKESGSKQWEKFWEIEKRVNILESKIK